MTSILDRHYLGDQATLAENATIEAATACLSELAKGSQNISLLLARPTLHA
jgi:hypothetical protein